jgi:hypothetical protein
MLQDLRASRKRELKEIRKKCKKIRMSTQIKIIKQKPIVVMYTSNPNAQKSEARGSLRVQG